MKEYLVLGRAMVPVDVEIKTQAASKKQAIKNAEEAFKKGPRRFIVGNSADESSAFDFQANEVEEQL